MSYIIIETHGGSEYAAIVSDYEGNHLAFDTTEEAEREAEDCQAGIIVEV